MNFSQLTTLQIGGPAKNVITVKTEKELLETIGQLTTNHESFIIIGSGSNLLVSDKGFPGTIIRNQITGIDLKGHKLTVKSGTILQNLVDFANSRGLAGLEKLAGIPGTVGGAVYGNAGAYGQTISNCLLKVKTISSSVISSNSSERSQDGNNWIDKINCEFSYRSSLFKKTKNIILEVEFELTPANSATLTKESVETIQKRLVKYPPGIKCPGSFFKNIIAAELPKESLNKIPPKKIVYGKLPAGTLLEMVGAKGDQQGQIKIADYHANLFINLGGGTARDFYQLAKKYADKVKRQFDITLKPEVQLINLPPFN